ncbi:MAG: NAD(P)H-binding protein [Mycobacterium sp.]
MTMYLVTGAGGGVGSVSRRVVEMLLEAGQSVRAMVHHDDARADRLRGIGAEVVVGDLANPADVAGAMRDVSRMFFNMSVSPDYLQATAIVCAVAREGGAIDVIVNMSQMTVSQMTLTSTEESRQHRLHWLAEHVMDWSGVPRVHLRPTVFVDNPLFTVLGMDSVRERDVLALPFGSGHTSPIAATDVARVASTVLLDPAQRNGDVYELTGPEVLDIDGLAEQYSRALGRPILGADVPYDDWVQRVLVPAGLPAHVEQHIATMARLHRQGRYNRRTDDVERVTGQPAQTVAEYIVAHPDILS